MVDTPTFPVEEHLRFGEAIQMWVAKNRPRIEDVLGARVGDLIACGSAGCVYEFGKIDRVVKFPSDGRREAPTWQAYMQLQRTGEDLPALPIIDFVTELTPVDQPGLPRVFAIVREDVPPLEEADPERAEQVASDLERYEFEVASDLAYLWDQHDSADWQGEFGLRDQHAKVIESTVEELAEYFDELDPDVGERGLYDTMLRLAELGLPPEDLHGGNLGVTADGDVMIIDPISTPQRAAARVPQRLIANPVRHTTRM